MPGRPGHFARRKPALEVAYNAGMRATALALLLCVTACGSSAPGTTPADAGPGDDAAPAPDGAPDAAGPDAAPPGTPLAVTLGHGASFAFERVAVDHQDRTLLGGRFGEVDLGGGFMTSVNTATPFVARYDTTGALDWARPYLECPTSVHPFIEGSMPVLPDGRFLTMGELVLLGDTPCLVRFGASEVTLTPPSVIGSVAFVALWTATGEPERLWILGNGGNSQATWIADAVAVDGDVVIVGGTTEPFTLAGTPMQGTIAPRMRVVARLDVDTGAVPWLRVYPITGEESAYATATADVDGGPDTIVIAEELDGQLDPGCGSALVAVGGGPDVAVSARDPATGACVWQQRHGGAGEERPLALFARGGSLLVLIAHVGETVWGAHQVSVTERSHALAVLDGQGAATALTGLASRAARWPETLAPRPYVLAGDQLVIGESAEGVGRVQGLSLADGAVRWSVPFPLDAATASVRVGALARRVDGSLVVVGDVRGTLELPPLAPFGEPGELTGYLLRLAP
jgi:hypothetical protein